jgi:hypothetical protein
VWEALWGLCFAPALLAIALAVAELPDFDLLRTFALGVISLVLFVAWVRAQDRPLEHLAAREARTAGERAVVLDQAIARYWYSPQTRAGIALQRGRSALFEGDLEDAVWLLSAWRAARAAGHSGRANATVLLAMAHAAAGRVAQAEAVLRELPRRLEELDRADRADERNTPPRFRVTFAPRVRGGQLLAEAFTAARSGRYEAVFALTEGEWTPLLREGADPSLPAWQRARGYLSGERRLAIWEMTLVRLLRAFAAEQGARPALREQTARALREGPPLSTLGAPGLFSAWPALQDFFAREQAAQVQVRGEFTPEGDDEDAPAAAGACDATTRDAAR